MLRVFLVQRGGCSFVTKVMVAQLKGAEAVIMVDHPESEYTSATINRIVVADDGHGHAVNIPSILIAKEDGGPLLRAARDPENSVVVELAWFMPPDHVVLVDMWMSSGSVTQQRFMRDFAPKRAALKGAMQFVPHYNVFSITAGGKDEQTCEQDPNGNSYCAEDPDGPGPVTGLEVLNENIRQLCIHELYTADQTAEVSNAGRSQNRVQYAKEYWDYVSRISKCAIDGVDPKHAFGKTCSHRIMRENGIDVDKVEECAAEDRYGKSGKLRTSRRNWAWSTRAVRINGWRYTGEVDADLITRAICSAFITLPDACKDLVEAGLQQPQVYGSDGVTFSDVLTVLLITAPVGLIAACIYKRSLLNHMRLSLREEVMLEVEAAMGAYKQMG